MTGEREAQDLQRGRQYIAAAVQGPRLIDCCNNCGLDYGEHIDAMCPDRPGVFEEWPQNLPETLFGPYTCPRCCSYQHKDSDHRSQYGEAPPQ